MIKECRRAKALDGTDYFSPSSDQVRKVTDTVSALLPKLGGDFDGDGISNLYELEAISKGSEFYDPFVNYHPVSPLPDNTG